MATKLPDALPRDLRFEATPKRVRAQLAGATVADSEHTILIWDAGSPVPVYAFPESDVDAALLNGAQVRTYDDPDLRGYFAFEWEQMDAWLEEDEEVIGHPRDPHHRVDARRSSRHVRVELDGELLADSHTPTLVFETGLPVRSYLSREDVRMDLLEPSETETICAYKGRASYWSVRIGDRLERDLVWTYREPLPDAAPIRDLLCFFDEKLDVSVDGLAGERPQTQWSAGVRHAPRGGASGAHQAH